METRTRLALVLDGLPAPQLQVPVGPYRLDMAYPELLLGVEYDGRSTSTSGARCATSIARPVSPLADGASSGSRSTWCSTSPRASRGRSGGR